ncbi:MAG: hypothetical protein MJ197_04855 [Bacteroidales bacterium]|nr:hypothetical protein [Bacteroidales bacterium]
MEISIIKLITEALGHFLYTIFNLIIIAPFTLWKKAGYRLIEQKKNDYLKLSKIEGSYSFLVFLKRLFFEFLLDAICFISYFVGICVSVYALVTDCFLSCLGVLLVSYYIPVLLTVKRDILQLLLLPVRKLINWLTKPAQYIDLEIKNK